MIKTCGKLLLSLVVYTMAYFLASALMPFSPGFKEVIAAGNEQTMFFFFPINAAWVCGTIFFIIRNTHYTGKKIFLNILAVLFFVQCFMTQIETLFFGSAFPAMTKFDVILIMVSNLIPLAAVLPLEIRFFQKKPEEMTERGQINKKSLIIRLGLIGIIYLCVYMLFGYYVAWQFEELRIFYSGSPEKLSFWGQMANNLRNPVFIPFQIVRGILFGIFVLPLISMLSKSRTICITGICLVYVSTAVLLILPNPLFPDTVRLAHLVEMLSSMLLFGIIAGYILWNSKREQY